MKKNILLFIFPFFLVIFLILGVVILWFKFGPKIKNLMSGVTETGKEKTEKPLPTQKFIPAKTQLQLSVIKDFFSWSGWLVSDVEISQDGSSITISGLQEANWLLVKNDDPSSWPKIAGDFEISFNIRTELFPEADNPSVIFRIENQSADPGKTNYFQLTYYSVSSEFLFETVIKSDYIKLGKSLLPEPNKLRLQFKNIGSGKPETIVVFDNQTGQPIFEKQFSDVLFGDNSFFGLSFELEKGIKSLVISDLVLTGLRIK